MVSIDALIRTKRKTISISITPQGNVVVRAPQTCPMSYIEKIVLKREPWINMHKQKAVSKKQVNENLFNYKEVLFCGKIYPVALANNINKPIIYNDKIFIPFKTKPEKVRIAIEKWLRECADPLISERVEYFANLMQLKPSLLRLGNTKTSWGSCNRKQVITINWRCVMLPHDLIDYVIVHELSHILEFNHSKNFWSVVQGVLPDMKYRKTELKKGDYLLQLFRKTAS